MTKAQRTVLWILVFELLLNAAIALSIAIPRLAVKRINMMDGLSMEGTSE